MKYSSEEVVDRFKEFYEAYPDVSEPKYKKLIDKMKMEGKSSLYINFDDIIDFDFDSSRTTFEGARTNLSSTKCSFKGSLWC